MKLDMQRTRPQIGKGSRVTDISVWFCFVDLDCTFTKLYNAEQCKIGKDTNDIAIVYISDQARKPLTYG